MLQALGSFHCGGDFFEIRSFESREKVSNLQCRRVFPLQLIAFFSDGAKLAADFVFFFMSFKERPKEEDISNNSKSLENF